MSARRTRTKRPPTPREAPKIRDVAPPRRNESAAGGLIPRLFQWPYRAILSFLVWTGIRPWQLTVLSLVFTAIAGAFIVAGEWFAAGIGVFAASLADVFDGSVARHRGEAKRSGAFMDSVLDRVSDMVLFSCLFWAEHEHDETHNQQRDAGLDDPAYQEPCHGHLALNGGSIAQR